MQIANLTECGSFVKRKTFVFLCSQALGMILLLSALLKGIDIETFAVQVSYYSITRNPQLVMIFAIFLVIWELALGSAFVLGFQVRRSLILLLGTLSFFTIVLAWSWIFHDLRNCGCFGRYLPMTPGEAIAKNLLMSGLCIFVWKNSMYAYSSWGLFRKSFACILIASAAILIGYHLGNVQLASSGRSSETSDLNKENASNEPSGEVGDFSKYSFAWNGSNIDLGKGSYLVCLLSDSCIYCAEAIAKLNNINKQPRMPHVIGLVLGEEKNTEDFRQRYLPEFPLKIISPLEFFDLIGDSPPRVYLIWNGKTSFFWDKDIPTSSQISLQLSRNRSKH